MDPECSAALCRAYNNWLYDYCSIAPDRLFGMMILPLQDVELAQKELRQAATELGMRGIFWRPPQRGGDPGGGGFRWLGTGRVERMDVLAKNPYYRQDYQGQVKPSAYFRRGQCYISSEAEESETMAMLW